MHQKPFISICIPAFNAQTYIGDCIASITVQNFNDYEIVICDDGSEIPLAPTHLCVDSTNETTLRIRIIRQENAGTYAARQRAISEARGQYVFCMDADDSLARNDALQCVAAALEDASYPDVLLTNAMRENGTPCVDYEGVANGEIEKGDAVSCFFLRGGWNSMYTMAFKRVLFHGMPGRPRLLMAEDRLQKAEIFAVANTFTVCNENLYVYRNVAGSAMNSPFKTSDFYNRAYVGLETLKLLDVLGASREEWAQSFNGYVAASLFELGIDGCRSRAERIALYSEFRNVDGCDKALEHVGTVRAWKNRVCLEAFRDRRWLLLDVLLKARGFASKAKLSLIF